jgi:iron only hydrogenase large subunit-like protein
LKEIDYVLTVKELADLSNLSDINFNEIKDFNIDTLFGESTVAGAILETTSGQSKADVRIAYEKVIGQKLTTVNILSVQDFENPIRITGHDFNS